MTFLLTGPENLLLGAPLAVALSIAAMQQARVMHPPAAATALIAVVGGPSIHALGIMFAPMAGGASALLMGMGLLTNNIINAGNNYPKYW